MPEPGREQKTGQRSREIVQILPATLLVKRNLDLQHEPRYPDRGLKRFASFRFALEHQMDKPLQQNKSRLWMLVWQVLGLGLLLYGADHLVLITILNLEQVDLSTRFIQGCFGRPEQSHEFLLHGVSPIVIRPVVPPLAKKEGCDPR